MIYNILVTSVGGDIGGNIVSILNQQSSFKCSIIGIDIKQHVFSEVDLNYFYQVKKVDSPEYLGELKKIINNHQIELIIPSSEYDIVFLHKYMVLFETLKVKLLINNARIVTTFLNKEQTASALARIHISTPITYTLQDYNNELMFPLILKASSSTTSKMIRKINNREELKEASSSIAEKDKFIIQEYIGSVDEEYTTAVYRDNNITKVITFKRLLDGDKTGYAEIIKSKILNDYAIKIANYFDLNGSINIQSRKYNNDFYIFEINPRISSTVYIRNYFKFEDLLWWITDILQIERNINVACPSESGIAILGYRYRFYNGEEK